MARPGMMENRGFVWINVIARLRDGVPAAAAADAIDALYTQNHPSHRPDKADAMELTPLKTRALGGAAASVYTLRRAARRRSSRSRCSSAAPTWPTCSSRAARRGAARSPCAWRSAPAAAGSRVSC